MIKLLFLMPLAPLALFAGCGSDSQAKTAPLPPPPPAVVTVAKVERRSVPLESEFVGRTFARDTVRIVPRVTGIIESVDFTEGTVVKAGDVLFRIDRDTYETTLAGVEARLAQDRANLTKARKDLERLRTLLGQAAVSRSEVDATQASVAVNEAAIRADQAAIDRAKLDVAFTTISAPISGVIGKLEVTAGNFVTAGQANALATISSVDPIFVTFSVPEAAYLTLRRKGDFTGGNIHPKLLLADGKPYDSSGEIDFVDRALDATTGTISMRAKFPNKEGFLKPGQFARIRFEVERVDNAMVVPRIALAQVQSQRSVFVVGPDNKVTVKPVVVDREVGDLVIITSGLDGSETVVVEGTQKLRPGASVAPKPYVASGVRPEAPKADAPGGR